MPAPRASRFSEVPPPLRSPHPLNIFYKFYVFLLCNKEVFPETRKVAELDFEKAAQLYDS